MNFEHLRKLIPGWLDGQGQSLYSEGLDWLESSLDSYYPKGVWYPYLFPTPKGRVLAEWPFAWCFPSLEIDLYQKTGEWHNLHLITNKEDFAFFNLSTPEGWSKIVERIRKIEDDKDEN